MKCIKRDLSFEDFDRTKIHKAISFVFDNDDSPVSKLVDEVVKRIRDDPISVETIQDYVECVLMESEYKKQAKMYISYRNKRCEIRKAKGFKIDDRDDIFIPFGPIGEIVHKRTYARQLDDRTESFRETIIRVLTACQTQLKVDFTKAEINKAFEYMMKLKGSVGGRFLWQLGTTTVDQYGLMSLQNCAFCVIDEPINPFLWIFDILMLGCGVGCSIQRKHVDKIPPVKNIQITIERKDTNDADFIIPDSREGWIKFLKAVLVSFFETGESFTYSTVLVRPAGLPIKGFGGIASGPEFLCAGIKNICEILSNAKGRKLRPIECLDMIDVIASIVVSGNVRRSAIIMIGDCDDVEFLMAKRWDLGNIPNWRAMSNNSVDCDDISKLPDIFWEGYLGNGEPYGLVNLDLCRKIGRIKDGDKYPDPLVQGFNPCGEIPLSPWQTCCLSEIFLPNIESFEELQNVATMLYRICKHSLNMRCHHKNTEKIVHDEMKLGIGITGYMQCTEEQKGWLSDLYEYLREYDIEYSDKHGFPKSVRLTTVKPSGTLSLLAGVTAGCHPAIFKYFIRRIRVSSNNQLIEICRKKGYKMEFQRNFDNSEDVSTTVVEIPCKYPDTAILAKDVTAIDQLETIKTLQTEWSDNAVSCTIYYRKNELETIKRWLNENYHDNIKSCSFLLHADHGFKQAPYEEITQTEYEKMMENIKYIDINNGKIDNEELIESYECATGSCPVR